MADDDLYEDLNESGLPQAFSSPKRSLSKPTMEQPKSLTQHVQDLQSRVARLEEDNENLKRNMGTMYRTAVAEMARKDDEILRLNEQLSRIS